jgi:hypothetical protein
MTTFYAFKHKYGQNVRDAEDGKELGQVITFESRKERDAWVEDGPAYRNEGGYREAITSQQAARLIRAGRTPRDSDGDYDVVAERRFRKEHRW